MLCLFLVYFIFIFNDFSQTNYLNIHETDLRQIFRVDRMNDLMLVFLSLVDVAVATDLVGISTELSLSCHRTEFLSFGEIRQMAIGEQPGGLMSFNIAVGLG